MLCPYKTASEAFFYLADAFQRNILFTDTLIEQGNIYFEHIQNGKPPVINFNYEIIMDGRDLNPPVNYALARILSSEKTKTSALDNERPVVIIDPRSGYGPGISGTNEESEIGIALKKKRPVYFIFFFPEPESGQNIPDVINTQIKFLEKINELHPKSDSPSIIANCQAGWAILLVAALRPNLIGPLVLNGSPISYWAGKDIEYPMRFKSGLVGGLWMVSLWSDLGNGKFDGANLVKGFEDLDLAGTYWNKPYNLYSNIDTERKNYLDFQRWWNGYYFLTSEEIKFITEKLFIRNQLEKGDISLDDKTVDLRNVQSPLMIFCSKGDSISPPQQALNWIMKVWPSDEIIKSHNQIIIYLVHESVEHINMFVSGEIAVREHDQILKSVELIDYLSPGLYEMIIDENNNDIVIFEERSVDDILKYDDGLEDEEDFEPASTVSAMNQLIYKEFFSPYVKFAINENTAELIRCFHPLRIPRYIFSDLNPLSVPVKTAASLINDNRLDINEDNIFYEIQNDLSEITGTILDSVRKTNDMYDVLRFKLFYGNPLIKNLFAVKNKNHIRRYDDYTESIINDNSFVSGNPIDGIVRIMIAVAGSGNSFSRSQLLTIADFIKSRGRFKREDDYKFKKRIKLQSAILRYNRDEAIKGIGKILKKKEDKKLGIAIAEKIAEDNEFPDKKSSALIKELRKILS